MNYLSKVVLMAIVVMGTFGSGCGAFFGLFEDDGLSEDNGGKTLTLVNNSHYMVSVVSLQVKNAEGKVRTIAPNEFRNVTRHTTVAYEGKEGDFIGYENSFMNLNFHDRPLNAAAAGSGIVASARVWDMTVRFRGKDDTTERNLSNSVVKVKFIWDETREGWVVSIDSS